MKYQKPLLNKLEIQTVQQERRFIISGKNKCASLRYAPIIAHIDNPNNFDSSVPDIA
jgi:hypothetical protein